MSSPGFDFFRRVGNERLERNAVGDVLKKYNGTPTSWPTHSIVQSYGETHRQELENIKNINRNVTDFFQNNF
jgi:hypothetical protein